MAEFCMPSLGSDMESGTVVEWMVKPGDSVKRGDIVAAIETAKGVIEVEIFANGTIDEILVPIGEEVPVGTPLATYRAAGEAAAVEAPPPAAAQPAAVESTATVTRLRTPPAQLKPARSQLRVSPLARKLAGDARLDLAAVKGTGPAGSIVSNDINKALGQGKSRAGPRTMRESIGAAMSRAKRDIPHYYVTMEVDLKAAMDWLAEANAARPVKARILPAALLMKATALTLRDVPELNGFYVDGRVRLAEGIHVASVISLKKTGLMAPAIHDTDKLSLDDLMAAFASVIERSRTGGLRGSEMTDATITITNLGDRGVDSVLGIIYPPQLALVGFGRIGQRPVVIDGEIVARPMVTASLSADHRATDGYHGSRFLRLLDGRLQQPHTL